jgi:formyl-CoA transferase
MHAIDRPELADDPRYADHVGRGRRQDELDDIIAAWAMTRRAAEIDAVLTAAGVVCGPVNTIEDVLADPQFRARDMFVPHHDEAIGADVLGPGIVPKLSATPGRVKWAGAPRPGHHNAETYGRLLGLDAAALAELAGDGVI